MTTCKYKLTLHIIGNDINKIIYKNYNIIDELYEIFKVLTKLEQLIFKIDILNISFNIDNTKSNIIHINRFSDKILKSKFVTDFCIINQSKILLYDEEIDSIRHFKIILNNDESLKNMDIHIQHKTRSDYHKERTLTADP